MTDKKISQLTGASTPLAGTEVLPIVQSGSTVKVASDDLTVKNVRSNATTGILQVAGPGVGTTRTMTVPDANFTAARTDDAQTFTGNQTFSTIFATTVDTNVAAAGVTLSGTTLAADGTDADIPIFLAPKGSGRVEVTGTALRLDTNAANVGKTLIFRNVNSANATLITDGNFFIDAEDPNRTVTLATRNLARLTVQTGGDVTLNTGNLVVGTAGKGIDFSANTGAAGMTSELLNWYEEGTWTPGIAFGGASAGVTYDTSFTGGQYTRIGNRVFTTGYLIISDIGSSTGDATITGLPFTSKSGSKNYLAANILFEAAVTFTGSYGGRIAPNKTDIDLFQYSTAGVLSFLSNTNFSNGATIYISAQYAV